MSAKRKVISLENMHPKLPVIGTMVWYLFLDHINAPEWLWGAMGFLFLLGWCVCIYGLFNIERVDIFKEPK